MLLTDFAACRFSALNSVDGYFAAFTFIPNTVREAGKRTQDT